MSSPDIRRPRIPMRHPACPGKSRCQFPGCICNAPISNFLREEPSVDLYEVEGMHGDNLDITCVRSGMLYQRLDDASESGTDVMKTDDGPRITMRHPACPGKSRCQLPSCICNKPISRFPSKEPSVDLYKADAMHGANPDITCVRSGSLDAASESGTDVMDTNDEPKTTIGTMGYVIQKIGELSSNTLDRMKSCFS